MLMPSARTLWLFDYDLTLYGAEERGVLDSLDANITAFVSQRLGLAGAEANRVRQAYCREFGTTLGGLQARHGVGAHEFFDYIHNAGAIQMPVPDPRKKTLLQSLPGTRFVFTNARRDWAERGIAAMGITDCFAALFDLEFCAWVGKPAPEPYASVEAGLRALGYTWERPGDLVLLDDKVDNLRTARERGWSTVLVHPDVIHATDDYDACITHLLELPDILVR